MIAIKRMEISNFRSIRDTTLDTNHMNILVGRNDVGKSNVLRALNLFFNGETDPGVKLAFGQDFCADARVGKRKARQIEIRLTVKPPPGFRTEQDIIWMKSWRSESTTPHADSFTYADGSEFESRSKVPFWLKQLRYRYVPAIKGPEYFSELLIALYTTLTATVNESLIGASSSFTSEIQRVTDELAGNLLDRLGFESALKFPHDLSPIFRSLEFETDAHGNPISLANRGDGIKNRHIPAMLYFLARQENANKAQGSPRIDTIWGYEEPENNLEMFAAFEMAKEMLEYSPLIQMFITTHSPAFYNVSSLDEVFHQNTVPGNNPASIFRVTNSQASNLNSRITYTYKDSSEHRIC